MLSNKIDQDCNNCPFGVKVPKGCQCEYFEYGRDPECDNPLNLKSIKEQPEIFDRKQWNKKMSALIKEHPELGVFTGHFEVFSDKGEAKKVKIKDKTI